MPYSFAELSFDRQLKAGGKGKTLARLSQGGYPVPPGLIILPLEFENDELKPQAWVQIQSGLTQLRKGQTEIAFAVRSSGVDEDSDRASFAGEFETVLGARTDEEVYGAIHTVRRSRNNALAAAYSAAQGLEQTHELAVVVQQMVQAEFSGVLFSADPVTGNLMKMQGNFIRGLGEKLVGGQVNPRTFSLDRPSGKYIGPPELKRIARQLYRLAVRLDVELGASQDIEWATEGDHVYILQARPITSMREFNPRTGELNSSLLGDFLWSNGNAAEIQPEVMTLLTWSVGNLWGKRYSDWWSRYPASGNIGGRNYFNISIQVSPAARIAGGLSSAMRFVGDWWGRIPAGITIPLVPFTIKETLFKVIPMFLQSMRRIARYREQIPGFVSKTPAWCRNMRVRLRQINNAAQLAELWRDELKPYYCFGTTMAGAAGSTQTRLQAQLRKLVGEADANALLSNLGGKDYLSSLGPLVNLKRVACGELSRQDYLEQWGHRGPYEFELARPQPLEDAGWLDLQLADYVRQPFEVESLLEKQRAKYEAAWQRFCMRHPHRVKSLERQLAETSRLANQREAARSEITRVMGVIRAFALRAGELSGLGEAVFQLTIDELICVLGGDLSICRYLPARKETYARYCSLPPYPPVISGRFDPFRWASDPDRRSDAFDAHISLPIPTSNVITGFAGAAGVVEGAVRRIDRVEDGHMLQAGEILVTIMTNIGWTPLFPRAAAIVTDVGAPLSHAAIVARELGIPAVVGCNDATMRLKSGDRIRVDGARGIVEILKPPEEIHSTTDTKYTTEKKKEEEYTR